MRIGPLEVVSYSRKRRRVAPPIGDPSHVLGGLESLAQVLRGVPWMLAGGLSIPVSIGEFYREHGDVDIVFPLEGFSKVDQAMREAGYALVTRLPISWKSRGMVVQVRTRASSRLIKLRPKRLSFVRRLDRRDHASFISKVDVYPFRESSDHLETCDYGVRLEKIVPILGCTAELASGCRIPCFNLFYVSQLKALRGGATHRLDRAVIVRGAEAAEAWFAMNETGSVEHPRGPSAAPASTSAATRSATARDSRS